MFVVREIEVSDSMRFIELNKTLDRQSAYMLLEPGERITKTFEQEKFIINMQEKLNKTILIAENNNQLVAFAVVNGGDFHRNCHTASVVIGVLEEYHRKGVASKLMDEVINCSRRNSICRLELTVMSHNTPAIELYKKMGFQVEGVRNNSLLVNGTFVDEYYMAIVLGLDVGSFSTVSPNQRHA